jgi:tRNA pseudouridine55 synthase
MPRTAPRGRRVDGILLLDKPTGISSNTALQRVKRLFDARKAGHTGSLDPLASGMLPICLGEATKLATFLLCEDKRYRVRARLGLKTSTADAEGEVTRQCDVPLLDGERIEAGLQRFRGESIQTPPMYSALKHQGRRLYEFARAGEAVERTPRAIRITELVLRGWGDDWIELELVCSKGTYVRTLIEDIAQELGTCGHVIQLRRLSVGEFAGPMTTLADLEECAKSGLELLDKSLISMEIGLGSIPAVDLDKESAFYLQRGQAVRVRQSPTSGWVRIRGPGGLLLGMGEITEDGLVAPRRLLNLEPAELG